MRHVGETPHHSGPQDGRFDRCDLRVTLRTHRRTALVELFGELDLVTVAQVGEAIDSLNLDADGFRHIVLDLRGLTFMDSTGLHELVRQSNAADNNRHNLTVVRGRASSRLMSITAVDARLVLVEHPDDLVPPSSATSGIREPRTTLTRDRRSTDGRPAVNY